MMTKERTEIAHTVRTARMSRPVRYASTSPSLGHPRSWSTVSERSGNAPGTRRPHRRRVPEADRRHVDDLPVVQLHPIVVSQDARPGDLVVLVDGEAMADQLNGHRLDLFSPGRGSPPSSLCGTPARPAS